MKVILKNTSLVFASQKFKRIFPINEAGSTDGFFIGKRYNIPSSGIPTYLTDCNVTMSGVFTAHFDVSNRKTDLIKASYMKQQFVMSVIGWDENHNFVESYDNWKEGDEVRVIVKDKEITIASNVKYLSVTTYDWDAYIAGTAEECSKYCNVAVD